MTRLTFTCLLTYLLFFSVGNLHAQSIVYVYDAAGNRVSRAYVVPLRSASIDSDAPLSPSDTARVSAAVGALQIDVLPNPTHGDLRVDVRGINATDPVHLSLYDANARLLLTRTGTMGTHALDLSSYALGWYILRVQAAGKHQDFKIIKH